MAEVTSGIMRETRPPDRVSNPHLKDSEIDPALADQQTYSSLLRSLDLARDDQFLFHKDKDGNIFVSRGRREKGKPVLAKDVLQERFNEAYELSLGKPELIDQNLVKIRGEVALERKAIEDAKRELRKKAREKYAPHSRRDKDQVEEWYQTALTGGQFQAFEDQVRKKQLIINVLAGKSQALKGKQERDKAVAEYKKYLKTDQNPSASQLSNFIRDQRVRREALGPQAADLERQRKAGEILGRIAERRRTVSGELELRLRGLGFELGRVLDAIRRRPRQALAAAIVTAVTLGTLAYAATRPILPSEVAEAIHQLRTQGIVMRSATPEPLPTLIPAKPTEVPPKPTEPAKIAEAKPTAIPPTVTRVPISTAVPTRTAVPASPTAVPTEQPSPTATRPPATATREPQPTAVPTKTETTGVALAEADKKTKEAVMAATEAYPGIEGVRKLKIPKPEALVAQSENLFFDDNHAVNIVEFDFNWTNGTKDAATRAKYYDAYAQGVYEGLKAVYDVNSHMTVILEPGHQSNAPTPPSSWKGPRIADTGSGVTLANGTSVSERKYNMETAKALAKKLHELAPNWTVAVTVDDSGFDVVPLGFYDGKMYYIDNPDVFVPLRFAENQVPGKKVRLALHYNGAANDDEAVNRRGGDIIPPATGNYRDESMRLAKSLITQLQAAVRKIEPGYEVRLYDGDEPDNQYLITESHTDQRADVVALKFDSLRNKLNRRIVLANQPGGYFYDKKHNQPVQSASSRP